MTSPQPEKTTPSEPLIVIGGGLAGSEAAWQAAGQGLHVQLYEMRPQLNTGAHVSHFLAELVCSNSLGSNLVDRASGLLKEEMRRMNSLLMRCAEETAVPAGGALAVDREGFGASVTRAIERHPRIELIREEMPEIPPTPAIVASGPLPSTRLSQSIARLSGAAHLYFYDAISPLSAWTPLILRWPTAVHGMTGANGKRAITSTAR